MKEGDLISTYYKGFYRLEKIERRFHDKDSLRFTSSEHYIGEEYSPLFHFIQEYDSNGKRVKGKLKHCDGGFCKLAVDFITAEIEEMNQKIKQLNAVVEYEKTVIRL